MKKQWLFGIYTSDGTSWALYEDYELLQDNFNYALETGRFQDAEITKLEIEPYKLNTLH